MHGHTNLRSYSICTICKHACKGEKLHLVLKSFIDICIIMPNNSVHEDIVDINIFIHHTIMININIMVSY